MRQFIYSMYVVCGAVVAHTLAETSRCNSDKTRNNYQGRAKPAFLHVFEGAVQPMVRQHSDTTVANGAITTIIILA